MVMEVVDEEVEDMNGNVREAAEEVEEDNWFRGFEGNERYGRELNWFEGFQVYERRVQGLNGKIAEVVNEDQMDEGAHVEAQEGMNAEGVGRVDGGEGN